MTYLEQRSRTTCATVDAVWTAIASTSWYVSPPLWHVRGAADRLIGGPGARYERAGDDRLTVGDALGLWRVAETVPPHRLRLLAKASMPGRATMTLTVDDAAGGTRLDQRVTFDPVLGIGDAYWWSVKALHPLAFGPMLRAITNAAERA